MEWWSYPYVFFWGNYIPIAILLLFVQVVEIIIGSKIQKKYNIGYIRCSEAMPDQTRKFIFSLSKYGILVILLAAFAQTNPDYNLHRVFVGCARNLRQIDSFAYAILFFMFIRGSQFKNCHTYYNKLLKYVLYLNYVEMFIMIFSGSNEEGKGYITLKVQVAMTCVLILINSVLENVKVIDSISNSFDGHNSEELFEVRKLQQEEIYRKIVDHTGEGQMTIFISDEWGGGKSFFMERLSDRLEKTEGFYPIWININEFSEKETFIKQILHMIYVTLTENNYYVGHSSEFEIYLHAILNNVLDEPMSQIFVEKFETLSKGKLEQSKTLTEICKDFSEMLGGDRIVIMVDDMDRCTEKMIAEAVKVFSEILFLPKSIIVFAGDYKYLLSKKEFRDGFFDKYFMRNYNLRLVPYETLFEYYQQKYRNCDLSDLPETLDVPQQIRNMIAELKGEKKEKSEKNPLDKLEQSELKRRAKKQSEALEYNLKIAVESLEMRLSNPRRVMRIYNEIYDQLIKIEKAVKDKNMNRGRLRSKLIEIVFPAILFYSLAWTVCPDCFWDICAEDFNGFTENVLQNLFKITQTEIVATKEEYIYMLLVYYFFSSDFNNARKIVRINKYYQSPDVGAFLEKY